MGISFEGSRLESADIEHFYEKAQRVLKDAQINEKDFINPELEEKEGRAFADEYSKETVERDLETVKRDEAHHQASEKEEGKEEAKMIAEIFEAIVVEHGELSEWFGSNAFTLKTSKYDDYENGVDIVIEFEEDDSEENSHLGLAADVTFRSDSTTKFDRIKKLIEKGRLASVKYFKGAHQFPEVVVGADKNTVAELAILWTGNKNKILAEHKIQIMILTQIREQLIAFSEYADSFGKADVAKAYRESLETVNRILDGKKELANKVRFELDDDSVHLNIMSTTARLRTSLQNKMAA
ncbi:MAG: hypothetical protein WA051_01460 [Minisyncoccia bacterium]